MSRHKTEIVTGTIAAALSDALTGVQTLAEEMGEWRDNTEESLGHTNRWQRVSEAADALEEVASELGASFDLPEWLEAEAITWTIMRPYGRKAEPRWMRAANAAAPLRAIVEALAEPETLKPSVEWYAERLKAAQELLAAIERNKGRCLPGQREEIRTMLARIDTHDGLAIDSIADARDTLDTQIDALEQVDFPGMYG